MRGSSSNHQCSGVRQNTPIRQKIHAVNSPTHATLDRTNRSTIARG
jgi:hypothetical protein